ncbi:MAG: hypothetical protein AABY22_13810 [Nanoarchaeota archaeon]
MNKKGQLAYIVVFLIVLAFLLLSFFFIEGLQIKTTENGSHTGYVTAVETNGLFFKTDSVYFKTDTESTQEDRYCLIDESLKPLLLEYQQNKTLITIEFYDVIFYGWENCKLTSDSAIISGIKIEK